MTCVVAFTLWPTPEGLAPTDEACEQYWLPRLGPATWLLWRLLVDELDDTGDPMPVDLVAAARSLGIAGNGGTSRIGRCICRLERFGFLTANETGWKVRTTMRTPAANPAARH